MLRGRKRRLPSCFKPEPYYHGSESDIDPQDSPRPEAAPQQEPAPQQEQAQVQRQVHDVHERGVIHGQNQRNDGEDVEPNLFHDLESQEDFTSDSDDEHIDVVEGFSSDGDREEDEVPEADKIVFDETLFLAVHDIDIDDLRHGLLLEDQEEHVQQHNDEPEDYHSVFQDFCQEWMTTELDHTVSKVASNKFWTVAFKFIPRLLCLKKEQKVKKKIPNFDQIRRNLYDENTPEVTMEIGYKCKETNEVTIVHDNVTSKNTFPRQEYDKMYEIATVKVN